MRIGLLLYLIVFLVSGTLAAQTLQGVVTDRGTGLALSKVTVYNTITRQVAYTDANGFYTIVARLGDIIVFSYVGYVTLQRYKPQSVIIATMNIGLERKEYELEEFYVRPGHLTQYQLDSTERATIYKIPLQRRPPSPIMSPVSAIAEQFSRKAKRTYQFQKDFARIETEKFIDTRYTPELVTSLTGLTGDSIGYFMYAYPMHYDYARTASNLEMKMWIRANYKEWLQKLADSLKLH